jgi:hypothetical protein
MNLIRLSSHVLILLFICSSYVLAEDFIMLKDGMSAISFIVDTAGCSLVINRNGVNVTIPKKVINFIVLGTDTISYNNYNCNSNTSEANSNPQHRKLIKEYTPSSQTNMNSKLNTKVDNQKLIFGNDIRHLGRWHKVNGTLVIISSIIEGAVILSTINDTGWYSVHTTFSVQIGFTLSMGIWQLWLGNHLIKSVENN